LKEAVQADVLQMFVDSARAAGVGHGFYYSIMKNYYLCHSFSGANSCMDTVRAMGGEVLKTPLSIHMILGQ
jgi:hypothetical protein